MKTGQFDHYTVKRNMLYLIKKHCGNRLQAKLLIKLNNFE